VTQSAGGPLGWDGPVDVDSAVPTEETWHNVSQADLEELLHTYDHERSEANRHEAAKEALGRMLKPWLQANPTEELHDDERGFRGYLQVRRGPKPYDLLAIWNKDRTLFERLLFTGCLSVNHKAVEAQGAQVAGMSRYSGPEPVTYSLQVVKK